MNSQNLRDLGKPNPFLILAVLYLIFNDILQWKYFCFILGGTYDKMIAYRRY